VEAIPGPDGDLARCVALVELEIHVEHNKLQLHLLLELDIHQVRLRTVRLPVGV